MANPILLGKTGIDQYVSDSMKALGTKFNITIPVRTEGWFALRKTVEDAAVQLSAATNSAVSFDTSSPTAMAFSLAVTVPLLMALSVGQTVDQQRIATLSKLIAAMAGAQTANGNDVAPLGLTAPTTSMTATLPQAVTYKDSPGSFEVLGGTPLPTNDGASYIVAVADDAPNTGGGTTAFMPNGRAVWQYSAVWNVKVTNGRYIEIATREMAPTASAGLRLWVNGRLAHATRAAYQANAGTGTNYTLYDLGAIGTYEIGIELNGPQRFYGVRVEAGATVSKPTRPSTVTELHIGDSYTSGVAINAVRGDSLMNRLGRYLGSKNTITSSVSGAALVTNTGVKLIPQFYSDFIKGTIAPPADPDIIVIAAGYNDNGSQAPTVAAAYALWQQVRADFPRALIVVVGMWGGVIQARATLQNREEALRSQFATWADPFSIFVRSVFAIGATAFNAFQYGTGYQGTPAFDGINDYILQSDRNHLTDGYDQRDGQWYVSTKLRDAIIAGVNAFGVTYNPTQAKVPLWPLTIKTTTAAVPAATVGSPYLLSVMATGGATARTFSIVSGSLPPGLTLQATAGHITGMPITAGSYAFTIRVSDGTSTADLPVTVVVS